MALGTAGVPADLVFSRRQRREGNGGGGLVLGVNVGVLLVHLVAGAVEDFDGRAAHVQAARGSASCLHCVSSGSTSARLSMVAASLLADLGSGWHSRNRPLT